ncbi:enoyl-CoA delta isomerase 1, peroxisomal-like [Lingula anatina]|uniref:Enoyl-CoA delta isomerase 1, peroxisomal-like n=1 Tax=Lingula anatina TaxID=7574 RepID=A0A1S3JPI3_LINAN|nr:enoyl-CoA delta isomerase 1, peroxisomal-like [Lingula anatina]|eukprot:XP_013412262.1 enoyl-CoA delta isomerase 1, peroxisomal-like [Lingula anatina]
MAEDFGVVRLNFFNKIAVIRLVNGDNKINGRFVQSLNKALDSVEGNPNIKALVTTGEGKFYSNGLDVEWFSSVDDRTYIQFFQDLNELLSRLLTFPMPTVAALNGHAFAGGGILALCHDYRTMRTGAGWLCLNEVHIKLRFSEFIMSLLKSKISSPVLTEVAILGKRFTAEAALEAGLVKLITGPEKLIERSLELANSLVGSKGYDRVTLQNMKKDMHAAVLAVKNSAIRGKAEFEAVRKRNASKL